MPEAQATTAEAQLERVLYVLAAARGDEGVPLAELAARLGVAPTTIYAELAQVRDREYYYPAGSALGMLLLLERDRVSVPVPGEFRRPTRLTVREAAALGLALRARAAEASPERRGELLALAEALEAALTPSPRPQPGPGRRGGRDRGQAGAGVVELDLGDGAHGGTRLLLGRAIEEHTPVRIRYLKPGDVAPGERIVHPYELVFAEGVWYVIARSVERQAVRLFRLDRVLGAAVLEGSFEVPADFDPADYTRGSRPYRADREVEAVVHYSARVAPWILEHGEAERCADGSVIVRHRVADAGWLVREVLHYAGEAVVLQPADLQEAVLQAAERLAAAQSATDTLVFATGALQSAPPAPQREQP